MLYKLALTFESVKQILKYERNPEEKAADQKFFCGTVLVPCVNSVTKKCF